MPYAALLEQLEDGDASEDVADQLKEFIASYLGKRNEIDLTLRIGEHYIPAVDVWLTVLKNGGNEAVTTGKLWASIGRTVTNPPQGMTDLSHRVKTFYQKRLLPAEMELRGAPDHDVAAAAAAGAPRAGRGRGGRRGGGRAGRAGRRRAARPATGADLLGRRVLVLHGAEGSSESEWHIGTVEAFDGEKHSVRFDSEQEPQAVLLAEGAPDWRTALKRHEDEASQFGGIVANPDSRKGKANHMEADADLEMTAKPLSQDATEDTGVIIEETEAYKVREVHESGKRSYEAYIMAPGVSKDNIKVKCWPEGRLRVRTEPAAQIEAAWPKSAPVEHIIQLPTMVDPHSASALLTLHGLLFVKVTPSDTARPTSPVALPMPPSRPASAPAAALRPATHSTQAHDLPQSLPKPTTLEEPGRQALGNPMAMKA